MKKIEGFEKYLVDEKGNVYSSDYNHSSKIKMLKTYFDKDGYKYVIFVINNQRIKKQVHRLIALTFIPNPLNKPQVNHKNGVKDDNKIDNLEWVTSRENIIHNYRVLGRKASKLSREKASQRLSGERNMKAKTNCREVENIRQMREKGMMYKDIKNHVNISISQICSICNGKSWNSISNIHEKGE